MEEKESAAVVPDFLSVFLVSCLVSVICVEPSQSQSQSAERRARSQLSVEALLSALITCLIDGFISRSAKASHMPHNNVANNTAIIQT